MKTTQQLTADGLKLLAVSTNGNGEVSSYIAKRKGRRVYGVWDHVKQIYREEPNPKH